MGEPQAMNKPLQALGNIHHAAYRCVDAEQTRWFYEDLLGLTLAAAFEEDIDFGENLGRNRHFLHIFFEMADGNYIAFFDEPGISKPEHFGRKDSFDMHLAFETESLDSLREWQDYLNAAGKTCLGPIDHGFVHSVYMYDPNGIQVEITCRAENSDAIMKDEAASARDALNAWTAKTRKQKEEVFGAERLDKRGRG
jgi:catechol 2,3-dioxygenase-like lactoylglutathione lyase family enzyme|tara:strand:+ start:12631 stop:13218 length:588 start_codon:yes stop_codon:yes gene_type:complete